MDSVSVPAKVLLIGEYSVVEGGQALLAALKPAFVFQKKLLSKKPHPESPLGRYLSESAQFVAFELKDEGLAAGFGTSTAELIAGACLVHGKTPETLPLWDWYKKKYPEASGADLVVQLEALRTGRSLFRLEGQSFESFKRSALLGQILVFRSKPEDKLKTHEALAKKRKPLSISLANSFVKRVETAFVKDQISYLVAMNEFADYLAGEGLETPRAHLIRTDFFKLPSVLAVKGCGAGLNDVFLIVKHEESSDEEMIHSTASKHGLSFVGTLEERLW